MLTFILILFILFQWRRAERREATKRNSIEEKPTVMLLNPHSIYYIEKQISFLVSILKLEVIMFYYYYIWEN